MNTVQRPRKIPTHGRHHTGGGHLNQVWGPYHPPGFMPALETLLGIVAILAVAALLPGQSWGLVRVQPHPLWIVVLAIAARYGALSGYFAGGISALTYMLLLWTCPEAGCQPVTPHTLIQPFLMFVIGALLGELVDGRERRVAELESRHRELESHLEALWQRYKTIETVKVELEKQIAFQSSSILTLSTLGKRLQSLNIPELHQTILDLVATVLEADACSLYLWRDGELRRGAAWFNIQIGRPERGQARPGSLSTENPLIRRAIHERRVATIRDRLLSEDSKSIASEPILMAGPLALGGGQIYGLVLIESIPFTKFTPSAVDRFDMILGWASAALENALRYQQSASMLETGRTARMQQSICSFRPSQTEVPIPK